MSSIRTHHSGNSLSATPPVIPPLDLRPQFPGPLPQDSLLSRDIVDEALGIHDDESTKRESFVTAPSAYAPRESRYSAMLLDLEYEPLDEEELSSNQPSDSSHDYEHSTLRLPQAARTHSPARPVSRTSTHPPSYSFPHPHVDHDTEVRTPSMRSLDSAKRSSSFIDRRFEESALYLGSHTECSSARQASDKWAKQTENSDTAKTLFWVGFIAPWCWLIGGWLVKAKKNDRYTRGGAMLPLWTGKSARSGGTFKMQPLHHGYPFVAPSVQSLVPPLYSRTAHPRGPFLMARSPWIRRCRIAACVSGIIIMLLFIAALVVVGRSA
jgi:hypothetical protein